METLDDIIKRVEGEQALNKYKNNSDDFWKQLEENADKRLQEEEFERQRQSSFSYKHPIVSSFKEVPSQLGKRTLKSFPEFIKGLNDTLFLGNEALKGIRQSSPLLRYANDPDERYTPNYLENALYWQEQADKIKIDPKYQGLKGLSSKETFLPTVAGELGGQATNIATALAGGIGGTKLATQLGIKGLGKSALTFAGTSIPNLAQEGQYIDKIEQFKQVYGRFPTQEELKQIQNVALSEKTINTALETVADRLLFGKLFPQGTTTKGIKNVIKNAGQQALTEGITEGLQETTSIGAEKLLGINQGNNVDRLLESMAIGGLVGGVTGAGATALSQPYDTQFQQSEFFKNAQNNFNNTVNQATQNIYNNVVSPAKVVADEIVNRLNPNNYETIIEATPIETGVGLSQHTEYVPQVKRVYRNPNAVANETIDINAQPINPQQQVNQPLLTNTPMITDNGTGFVLGESGNLVQNIAPNIYKKQQSKTTSKPIMALPDNNKVQETVFFF